MSPFGWGFNIFMADNCIFAFADYYPFLSYIKIKRTAYNFLY